MRRQTGFTLIEVLVALLVFGLIATAASQVSSQYIASYERVRDKTLAAWIADNRLSEVRLAEELPGISENSTETDFGPYRWRVTTNIKGTKDPTIRRIDVTVAKFRGDDSEPVNLHTLSGFLGAQ